MEKTELLYVREHVTCANYAADGPILQTRTFEPGASLNFGSDHPHFLCFLLQGRFRFRHNLEDRGEIGVREMIFIPRGDLFRGVALEPTSVVLCFLDAMIALCNEYTIKHLSDYLVETGTIHQSDASAILPIRSILFAELEVTRAAMDTGMLCFHYQREKRDIFLLMLRAFYSKEELAEFFRPALGEDFDFKHQILKLYTPSIRVTEMIDRMGLPSTSFNRKFIKVFRTAPKNWLLDRKKRDILNDLLMTDLSVKQLALKYGFTPNYFNKFCQQHLGGSPAELRLRQS